MIKAVFIDYTGTTVQENGSEIKEVVMRVCKNSDLHDPKDVMALWWKRVKQQEESCTGETYLTEDEIAVRVLKHLAEEIHLNENIEELHELIRSFWVYAPVFPDAKEFFAQCSLPIYIISNNGIEYVEKGMKDKGLKPAGIICGDMVQAYKPHRKLFEKALEVSGCEAEEVIHIGDSYDSDVLGALSVGIRPVLIDRTGNQSYEDVTVVKDLTEVLVLLK